MSAASQPHWKLGELPRYGCDVCGVFAWSPPVPHRNSSCDPDSYQEGRFLAASEYVRNLEEQLEASEEYAKEGWAWLGAALHALGASHVFEIPDWQENLRKSNAEMAAEAASNPAISQDVSERGVALVGQQTDAPGRDQAPTRAGDLEASASRSETSDPASKPLDPRFPNHVEGCICPRFKDIAPDLIADLTCPVHGVEGTDPGDKIGTSNPASGGEEWKSRVARIVTSYFEQSGGQGMTRAELAKAIGWKQTRNLPGVRAAIEEHLICYDGSPEGRLIPWDSYQESKP